MQLRSRYDHIEVYGLWPVFVGVGIDVVCQGHLVAVLVEIILALAPELATINLEHYIRHPLRHYKLILN